MNANTIAIFLYVGIMLMAATVLVLTIIYFVRPNSAKQSGTAFAEIQPEAKINKFAFRLIKAKSPKKEKIASIIAESKSIRERKTIKFLAIKLKLIKSKMAPLKHELKKNANNVKPVAASVEHPHQEKVPIVVAKLSNPDILAIPNAKANQLVNPEDKEAMASHVVELKELVNSENGVSMVSNVEMAEDKKAAEVKLTQQTSPENKDAVPGAKLAVAPEKAVIPTDSGGQEGLETEQPELSKPAVVLLVPNSTKLPSDIVPQTIEEKRQTLNENEKPFADTAVKKESEPKMDNKNVKTVTGIPEKPPTQPVVVKTTTITTMANADAAKRIPEQKPSLDDFSKMFAKETVDDSEATKLAKDMKDVEIDCLLKEGQDLAALLKRGRS